MVKIRQAGPADEERIWDIFQTVVASGDTYAFAPDTPRHEAMAYWFRGDTHTYVAEEEGDIVGTSMLRPNQPGLGAHVANAAFMVAPSARRRGVGRRMGEHCLEEARRLGFRAMQFNFVVSTNVAAVRLWQKLGFQIVGTLPEAFRHAHLGFVDVYVMYRVLDVVSPRS
ncbi:MAG: GNAT family N-acetyltransferase [Nitrospira sp.]|nr:GNAT family N-acetyltransferase [Nitrospira sp.]MCP9442174.1 GNAT family N-acetyltransferase [Nitrospira sp.]